jgi:hypothetical protein
MAQDRRPGNVWNRSRSGSSSDGENAPLVALQFWRGVRQYNYTS